MKSERKINSQARNFVNVFIHLIFNIIIIFQPYAHFTCKLYCLRLKTILLPNYFQKQKSNNSKSSATATSRRGHCVSNKC